jgi:hypothetical protein
MGKLTDVTTRYDSDRAAAKKAKYFAKQQKRSPSVSDVENNSELPWNDIEEKKEMWKKLVEQVWHEEKKKERKEKFAKLTSSIDVIINEEEYTDIPLEAFEVADFMHAERDVYGEMNLLNHDNAWP